MRAAVLDNRLEAIAGPFTGLLSGSPVTLPQIIPGLPAGPRTLYAVVTPQPTATENMSAIEGAATTSRSKLGFDAGGTWIAYDGATIVQSMGHASDVGVQHAVCACWDGAAISLYRDGVLLTRVAASSTPAATATLTVGTRVGTAEPWHGSIFAAIGYPVAHSAAIRQRIFAWLARRYHALPPPASS